MYRLRRCDVVLTHSDVLFLRRKVRRCVPPYARSAHHVPLAEHIVQKSLSHKCDRLFVAAELGIEPRQRDSETLVLPLHNSAICRTCLLYPFFYICQAFTWIFLKIVRENNAAGERLPSGGVCLPNTFIYFRLFSYCWIIFLTIWPPMEPACFAVRSPL